MDAVIGVYEALQGYIVVSNNDWTTNFLYIIQIPVWAVEQEDWEVLTPTIFQGRLELQGILTISPHF